MIIRFQPRIAPEDYDAFRRILNDHLPDTYDEWLQLTSQKASDLQGKGYIVEEVEIEPDEFVGYARAYRAPYNLHSLENILAEKTRRQR